MFMVLGYFTMLSRVYITRYSIQATLICVGLGFLKSTSFHLEVRTMMQASVNIASVTSVGYQYLFQVLDTFRYQTMILILKNRYFSISSFDTKLRYWYPSSILFDTCKIFEICTGNFSKANFYCLIKINQDSSMKLKN